MIIDYPHRRYNLKQSRFFQFRQKLDFAHTRDPCSQEQATLLPRPAAPWSWATAWPVPSHPKPLRGCLSSNLEPNLTLHLESADDTCRTEGWRVDDEQAAARAPDRCRMCVRSLRGARRRVRGSGRASGGAGAPLTGVAARTRRGVDPFECGRRERACRPPTVASGPALRLGR